MIQGMGDKLLWNNFSTVTFTRKKCVLILQSARAVIRIHSQACFKSPRNPHSTLKIRGARPVAM